MTPSDDAARTEILARLAASRADLQRIFDPPPREPRGGAGAGDPAGRFPRSRTMRMLMSGRGIGALSALALGLLVARPALGLRLLRLLPAGAMAKTLLMRAMTAMRSKQD
jgi:hypothetical protein